MVRTNSDILAFALPSHFCDEKLFVQRSSRFCDIHVQRFQHQLAARGTLAAKGQTIPKAPTLERTCFCYPWAMRARLLLLALLFSACVAVPLTIGFALPPAGDEYYEISQRVLNGIRFWANETKDWQLGSSTSTKGAKYNDFPIVVEETGAAESIGDAYVRLASKVDALVEFYFSPRPKKKIK